MSRYVALHAEQEAARRRLEDLTRRETEAESDLYRATQELAEHYVDDALDDDDVFGLIVSADFQPTVDGVLDLLEERGEHLDHDVLAPKLDQMVDEMRAAIEALQPIVPIEDRHDDWATFRRSHQLEVGHRSLWEWVYGQMCDANREEAKRIAREEREEARRKAAGPFGNVLAALNMPERDYALDVLSQIPRPEVWAADRIIRSQSELAEISGLEGEIAGAEASLRALGQERRLAAETYEATRQPDGFVLALQVLTFLAIVGMGVPVAIMGFGPLTLPWWSRALVVAVFFAGVGLLLRFLFVYASYLRDGGRANLPKHLWGLIVKG